MAKSNGNCSIVSINEGLAAIFSDNDGKAYMRLHDGKKWGQNEEIANDIAGPLSVNISDNKELFVFFQDTAGNIVLQHYNGSAWKKQMIQESFAGAIYNLKIHAIVKNGGIHLLYNIPTKITGETRYKIVSQEMSGGKWLPYAAAAENVADANPVFTVQNISGNHYAVFYQSGSMESAYGYRELYLPDKWSGFKALHQTLHSFEDKSVVTTNEGIHLAFILKGAYSCQLIYKNKLGSDISPPALLFEANRIDNVSIFLIKRNIHIVFPAGGYGFFTTVSKDDGKTFSRPARIRTNGIGKLIKAERVCSAPQVAEAAFYDIFTDVENLGSAPFLENLYSNYYIGHTSDDDAELHRTSERDIHADDEGVFKSTGESSYNRVQDNTDTTEYENRIQDLKELIADKNGKISILENKLEGSYREISEKNRQIMELNAIIAGKSEETATVIESYRNTIRKLRDEVSEKSKLIRNMNSQAAEIARRAAKAVSSDFPEEPEEDNSNLQTETENMPKHLSESISESTTEKEQVKTLEQTQEQTLEQTTASDCKLDCELE